MDWNDIDNGLPPAGVPLMRKSLISAGLRDMRHYREESLSACLCLECNMNNPVP